MSITCDNCEQTVGAYLCDIPENWRCQMITAICQTIARPYVFSCSDVKACETVTQLSNFTVNGNVITISFVNENQQEQSLSFDFTTLIDTSLDGLDPMCLGTQNQWDQWSHIERVQAIITNICAICSV